MRRLLLIALLLLPVRVSAAPAVIAGPTMGNSGANASSSFSFSATCPSGNSNVLAVVCVATHKQSTNPVVLSVVEWNDVSLLANTVGAAAVETASAGSFAQLFYLKNPTCDNSAHNVDITITSTAGYLTAGIVFLKDVDITSATPHDTQASTTGTASVPSLAVTSATGDLVVDCAAAKNRSDLAVGAGQTGATSATTSGTGSNNETGGLSYEAGAASVTMNWTSAGGTSASWAQVGASFNPAVTATRRPPQPRFYNRLFDLLTPGYVWARH